MRGPGTRSPPTKGLLDARQKDGAFVRPGDTWNPLDTDVPRRKRTPGTPNDFIADRSTCA